MTVYVVTSTDSWAGGDWTAIIHGVFTTMEAAKKCEKGDNIIEIEMDKEVEKYL